MPVLTEGSPATSGLHDPARGDDRVSRWLARHSDFLVLAVLGLALGLRLAEASGTYLNPDEALHFLLINQTGLAAVYRASLSNAHPPLFFLLLHIWRLMGSSEFVLRLFPVLTGTAALWFVYRWLDRMVGKEAALVASTLAALLPSLVAVSAEVRHYGLLLLFIAAALYMHERAWQERRWSEWLGFAVLLYAAILTHYSTLILVLALGVYGLVRLARGRGQGFLPWILAQAGAAGLYVMLYFSHIRDLAQRGMANYARDVWLVGSYFRPGRDSFWLFPGKAMAAAFQYMFGSPAGGFAGLLLFLTGLALLFVPRLVPGSARRRWERLLVLALPFATAIGLALAGLFPFGASRHTIFLAIFAIAGAGSALVSLAGRRKWIALAAALLLGLGLNLARTKPDWEYRRQDQRKELMTRAVERLEALVPAGDTLLADYQSSVLLGYYLGRERATTEFTLPRRGWHRFDYRGRTVIATGHSELWNFDRISFGREVDRLVAEGVFSRSERVPVFDAGWVPMNVGAGEQFGRNIVLFSAKLDSWPTPANLNHRLGRYVELQLRDGRRYATVLWPGFLLSDSVRRSLARVADRVMDYGEARDSLEGREHELVRYLPILAFWTAEREGLRPSFMGQMDSLVSFRRGGCWYELVAKSNDGSAAVYLTRALEAHLIDSLALEASGRVRPGLRAAIVPDEYLTSIDRPTIDELAGRVLTYRQLYDSLAGQSRSLGDYLPALTFWVFNSPDYHPEMMRYMEDREHYVSGGCRFTYLAVDPDTLVGLYLIEPDR